jgi:precorrin-3B synthase
MSAATVNAETETGAPASRHVPSPTATAAPADPPSYTVASPPARRPVPRDACPSLVAPMATGDGLIARLLPADGEMPVAALAAIAAAAARFGNGVVEVTQRGSLQVRGLSAETAADLERAVHAAGASPPAGPPVHVGPLAGLDPAEIADPRPLAVLLRDGLAAAVTAAAPAKLAIVVDGGGDFGLDGLSADLRLVAVRTDGAPAWRLETDDGPVSPPLAPVDAVAAAGNFVAGLDRSRRRRPRPRVPVVPVGMLLPVASAGGATAVGVVVPYGFTDAGRLSALAAAAGNAGAATVRLAPGHGLVLVGPATGTARDPHAGVSGRGVAGGGGVAGAPPPGEDRAAQACAFSPAVLLAAAAELGFIVRADDPRLALSVCAGAPACGSGEAPTRPLADAVVAAAVSLIAAGGSVHLSGCAKGCARAAPADLTIVGMGGRYGLVRDGRASDVPVEVFPPDALLAAVALVHRAG